LLLIAPGIVGGALGGYLLASLPPERVVFWMSLVLLVMGLTMLWRTLFASPTTRRPSHTAGTTGPRLRRLRLGIVGLVAGVLNALSGSYGPFATSAIMLTEGARPARAIGTVNLAEVFVASTVVVTLLTQGVGSPFSWQLVSALILGGALSAPVAAYTCKRLPSRLLMFGVGIALVGLNLRFIVWVTR
jgi:uncharacterized membrane protein YfcA